MKLVKTLLPILLSTFFLCIGNSMLLGLFTLMTEKYSWSGSYVGVILSIKGILAIFTAICLPIIAHKVKIFISLKLHFIAFISITLILSVVQQYEIAWCLLYAMTIIPTTFFFISTETVLISDVAVKERARGLSLYWLVAIAGYAIGPWLVGNIGLIDFSFYIVVMFFVISYCFIFSRKAIDDEHLEVIHFKKVFGFVKRYPLIWVICFVAGSAGEAIDPFMGVMGLTLGLSGEQSLNLMSFFLIGGVVMQYATGWLIDHLGVHRMTVYTSISAILIGVLVILTSHSYILLSFSTIAWGSACFGVSLLSLAIIANMFKGENKLLVVSVQAIFYDLGSVVGNTLNGISTDLIGAHGVVYVAILFFTITGVVGFIHKKRIKKLNIL
jgi:MFS family permease